MYIVGTSESKKEISGSFAEDSSRFSPGPNVLANAESSSMTGPKESFGGSTTATEGQCEQPRLVMRAVRLTDLFRFSLQCLLQLAIPPTCKPLDQGSVER